MFIFHFPSSGLKVFVREKIAVVNIHIKKRYKSNRNRWKLMSKIDEAIIFPVRTFLKYLIILGSIINIVLIIDYIDI